MRSDGFFAAFGAAPTYALALFSLLYLLVSIYVYISLIRQIGARTLIPASGPTKTFGLPEAILAAALVLFLLLGSVRTACISLTAIPLSLLTAVIILEKFGITINTITLGGLVIALGEVYSRLTASSCGARCSRDSRRRCSTCTVCRSTP